MTDKNPLDVNSNTRSAESARPLYGVFTTLVTDNADPEGQGRIKVMLPVVIDGDGGHEVWARLATLTGRDNRGSLFIPDVNDEVLIAFEGGDPSAPIIIGGLWKGSATTSASKEGTENTAANVLQPHTGIKVTLNDVDGQEQLTLETPNGQKLTLKNSLDSVETTDSNGSSIRLEASGVTINTPTKVTINASLVEVSAVITKFSGVVQCDTLISNVVVSASYTPGVGNIW
jgi:uncharacterized protein involved in type VI secretion and phage assembly